MRLKVLIIEDDPIQADLLARLLGSRGYYVDIAGNGREAVRRISAETFQVALVDYRLNDIDGVGIARVVRNLPGSINQLRLVALTSAPQDLVAYTAEFDEILGKPIVSELLFQAIERGRVAGVTSDAAAPQPSNGEVLAGTLPALPSASAGKRGRILLADDDRDLREFLRLTLESHGFAVDVAEDGLEAVKRMSTSTYDVVVVDFHMPKLDGLAAAKVIYDLADPQTRPRIVALTSTPDNLVARDQKWHLVLDEVVSKASGVQAVLLAVENCIYYKAFRSDKPLERLDPQSLTALMQSVS